MHTTLLTITATPLSYLIISLLTATLVASVAVYVLKSSLVLSLFRVFNGETAKSLGIFTRSQLMTYLRGRLESSGAKSKSRYLKGFILKQLECHHCLIFWVTSLLHLSLCFLIHPVTILTFGLTLWCALFFYKIVD